MKGIIVVVIIIGVLAVLNMEEEENIFAKVAPVSEINKNQDLVNMAKAANEKSQSSMIKRVEETSKIQSSGNANASSIMDMARKTNK